MISQTEKERLLNELRKTPVVEVACQRVGIGRTTYYRLRKESKTFAELADRALDEGRLIINDLGEAQTISLMKERDMQAIRFWLTHNNPRYASKIEISGNITHNTGELSREQRKLLKKSLKLALPQQTYDSPIKPEPKGVSDGDTGENDARQEL